MKSGGFVIVSATKNYYPILAYSETGSMNVEEAMKTGFSVWSEKQYKKLWKVVLGMEIPKQSFRECGLLMINKK